MPTRAFPFDTGGLARVAGAAADDPARFARSAYERDCCFAGADEDVVKGDAMRHSDGDDPDVVLFAVSQASRTNKSRLETARSCEADCFGDEDAGDVRGGGCVWWGGGRALWTMAVIDASTCDPTQVPFRGTSGLIINCLFSPPFSGQRASTHLISQNVQKYPLVVREYAINFSLMKKFARSARKFSECGHHYIFQSRIEYSATKVSRPARHCAVAQRTTAGVFIGAYRCKILRPNDVGGRCHGALLIMFEDFAMSRLLSNSDVALAWKPGAKSNPHPGRRRLDDRMPSVIYLYPQSIQLTIHC